MERQRLPYNIGLKAPFNVWLQVGCCPNSPPIVSKIVGILKDNDPLFPLCMLSNHCKVLPTPMYSPMKRLYRGIVVSTAGIFLEYSVEFLVVVPIEWMYVGETERLIPLDGPSNSWVRLIYQERRMWYHDCSIILKKIFDSRVAQDRKSVV